MTTKKTFSALFATISLSILIVGCQSDNFESNYDLITKHSSVPDGYYSKTIPYSVFLNNFNERLQYEYILTNGGLLSENKTAQFYIKTWNDLYISSLIKPETQYLGIDVSKYEIDDMIYGNHPHESIRKMPFLCDKNGAFQPNLAKEFVKRIENDTLSDPKITWNVFLREMIYEYQLKKYRSLFTSSFFTTPAEENYYKDYMETEIDFDYIFVPYTEINIEPSDESMYNLYKQHENEYFRQESRKVTIVTIKPTIDSLNHTEELKRFKMLKNHTDSDFKTLADKSETIKFYSADYNLATTQKELLNFFEKGNIGDTKGPFFQNNSYRLMKITDKYSMPDSVKVRHIMLREKDTIMVKELMTRINKNEDFGLLAKEYSSDKRSSDNGGEIGWIKQGDLVEPYNTACFSAPSGLYFEIESHNKRHIMHIMEVSQTANPHIMVDVLYMDIEPNAIDLENLTKTANKVSKKAKTADDLLVKAVENGYATTNIKLDNTFYYVPEISSSNDMVQWSFTNKRNTVSTPFIKNNLAYILTITDIIPTGNIPFEEVKDIVHDDYVMLYRKDTLYDKIKLLIKEGATLEENGKILKKDVIGIKKMLLASYDIPTLGVEYNLRGILMGMKTGETSKLFKGEKGLFIARKTAERKTKLTTNPNTRLRNQYLAYVSNDAYIGDIVHNALPFINIVRQQDSYILTKEYDNQLPYDSVAAKEIITAEYAFREENWKLALNGNSSFRGLTSFYENNAKETKQSRLAKIYAGICFMKLNENQKAIQVLSTIEDTHDFFTSSLIPILIGDAYSILKKNEKAIESYSKAINMGNSQFYNSLAIHKLALLEYMLDNNLEAKKYCEIFLKTNLTHYHSQIMTELLYKLMQKENGRI